MTTTDDDDGRRRRTMEAYLSYKLTKWAFGSGEQKTKAQISIRIHTVWSAPLLFAT